MADQLHPVPLITPGFKGLNKTQASVPDLDPGWAIECQNFIFDQSGRLASRQGWIKQTSAALGGTPAIKSMGELFVAASGATFVVSAANNKLYSGTTTLTDITGALTITGDNWQWLTFNGAIYGVQAGHPLIKWNGAGNFATIAPTSGAVPSGGTCGASGAGRLWILNTDNQTISYCNLLDDAAWAVAGAGSVNMTTAWTRGVDAVQGLAFAGSRLVVFGKNQIIILGDDGTSVLGLNPSNIRVVDTIEGTGLSARDTVQSTGEGELVFLSPTGIQSLQRLVTSGKQNPVATLDPQIRDYFQTYFVNEPVAGIRSAYSPLNRFYVILLPVAQRAFVYDTRQRLQDGSMRVTEWPGLTWTSILNQKSGTVLVGEKGIIGTYSGYFDNLVSYATVYNSPHLALQTVQGDPRGSYENHQKILKKLKIVLYYGGTTTVTFQWGVDFQGLSQASQVNLLGSVSEYGIAQYNINEYAGAGLALFDVPLSRTGRWIQFGFNTQIAGSVVAIQQFDAFVKIGNMV